jgi:hypothetical protein
MVQYGHRLLLIYQDIACADPFHGPKEFSVIRKRVPTAVAMTVAAGAGVVGLTASPAAAQAVPLRDRLPDHHA